MKLLIDEIGMDKEDVLSWNIIFEMGWKEGFVRSFSNYENIQLVFQKRVPSKRIIKWSNIIEVIDLVHFSKSF